MAIYNAKFQTKNNSKLVVIEFTRKFDTEPYSSIEEDKVRLVGIFDGIDKAIEVASKKGLFKQDHTNPFKEWTYTFIDKNKGRKITRIILSKAGWRYEWEAGHAE